MKILVLTSGGDSQGMNRFIYTLSKNIDEVFYAKAGFKGLVNNDIHKVDLNILGNAKNEAGTIILSSRYPEFKQEKYFKKGLKIAKNFDCVVIVGGNGSQNGAKELSEGGANTLFVPGTIDNDVNNCAYSLGFDSAVNQCVYVIENTMPSIHSFMQTCVFEVMGRECDAIAKETAKRANVDYLISKKEDINYKKIKALISKNIKNEKGTSIVLRENIISVDELCENLKVSENYSVKNIVIGRLQRGGKPTKLELSMADKYAKTTVKAIKAGMFGKNILADEKLEVKLFDM